MSGFEAFRQGLLSGLKRPTQGLRGTKSVLKGPLKVLTLACTMVGKVPSAQAVFFCWRLHSVPIAV